MGSRKLSCLISILPVIVLLQLAHELQFLNQSSATRSITELPSRTFPSWSQRATPGTAGHTTNLCTRQEIRSGYWRPVWYTQPPYQSKTVHLRCREPEYYDHHGYASFAWQPNATCHFAAWSAEDFCHLVNHTVVSIVGDSLSWEHYSSMLQLLGARVHQMDQHRSKTFQRNHVQRACNGSTRFVFRNDPRLGALGDAVAEDFPVILILNRGAHYENDALLEAGIQQNIVVLQSWQATCARLGLRCHLFWRTTVPGHPGCNQTLGNGDYVYQSAVNDLDRMEALIADPRQYNDISIKYHWPDFSRQNRLVETLLAQSNLSVTMLDAYELNIRRPDNHRVREHDCLHNCYPGKVDVYSQLLLHHLKRERSEEDVTWLQAKYEQVVAKARGQQAANLSAKT